MIDRQLILQTVEQALEGTDMFPVDVTVAPGNVVTVEIDSMSSVDIDTCAMITRRIEGAVDRDIEDYELEVGSAGLTSPLKVRRQYEKNIGNEVEVLTRDGRKMHGTLTAVNDDATGFTVRIPVKVKEPGAKRPVVRDEEITLPVADVKYVRYEITF